MNSKFWKFKNISLNEGELELYGEIVSETPWWDDDVTTYREFIQELKSLGIKDTIKVHINSGGGDVFAANAIYTQLKSNSANIHVLIEGICASAATIVTMAADKISIANNAVVMIHNPKIGVMGYYDQKDLEKFTNAVDTVKKSIVAAYKTKLKKTEEELEELMDNETWYTGQEAVDNGFADELMFASVDSLIDGNYLIVNNVRCDISKFKNIPNNIIKKVASEKLDTFFNTKNSQKEGKDVEIKNTDELIKAYPELINKITDEAEKKAISSERERLKSIDEIADKLPKEFVNKAKYENPITAENLAFEALKANQMLGCTIFNNMQDDVKNSNANNVNGTGGSDVKEEEKEAKINRLANSINKDKRRVR